MAATSQNVSGAPAQLTLNETWNAGAGTILNDAPCGVAEASPVEFNDGGTAAVEVGDRQGDLYGLDLQPARSCRAGERGRAAPSARVRAV